MLYYISLSSLYEYKIISINIKIAYTYKQILLSILTKNKCCCKLVFVNVVYVIFFIIPRRYLV